MGNSSQDPDIVLNDSLARGYFRVRFQQGKPVLDRELTLAADLASPRRLAARYLGDGCADTDGFSIFGLNVAGNDFGIKAGRFLLDGLELWLAADVSYRTQPLTSNVSVIPAGTSNVYLRVFSVEVGGVDDVTLQNAGDVGFETARREKVAWEVVVSTAPINAADHFLLAVIDTTGGTIEDRRRVGLSLAAVRDELSGARGSASSLGAHLATTLGVDGALNPGVIGTAALADSAITQPKLANASVPMVKLATSIVAQGQISVPAANGTVPGSATVVVQAVNQIAFHWVGVHLDAPQPVAPFFFGNSFTWQHAVALVSIFTGIRTLVHRHQISIQNPGTFAITVSYKVYRMEEA